jgi:BirA family transcriptional regulator, biotin operon repressor / biotin---[acetyl-CoA-carboxylase] ligase
MAETRQLEQQLRALTDGLHVARALHVFDKIDSTNAAAMKAGSSGASEGAVFLARQQLAGRGRAGHGWESEIDAGVYLSLLLRPQVRPGDALALSLLTGLAAADALRASIGIEVDLRWPNDLMLRDKKLGGVLIELSSEGDRVQYVVVGVGINVNQSVFAAELAAQATSLQIETGKAWPIAEVAATFLQCFDAEYRMLRAAAPTALSQAITRFEERSSYARGKRVQVEENGGYQGVTEGLDARGFLRVRTENGVKTVLSGGVRPA